MSRLTHYWQFIRPFTLLVPSTGMLAGALMAWGMAPAWQSDWSSATAGIVLRIVAGALMASALNGFSNGINQIYDIEVDRINKPGRPLPSGSMTLPQAWAVSLGFLALALGLGWWVNWQCLLMAALAALLTTVYSVPPLRTKGRGLWANFTIAIPRGTLLIVAGWSSVKDIFASPEPWIIGGVFGLFFLGAATTKDFADIKGDREGGCRTLPVVYGIRRTTRLIAPFFVLPFVGLLAALALGFLSGNPYILGALGVLLSLWGAYIAATLVKSAEKDFAPQSGMAFENHPSWKHMYLLTMVAQIGFASAYLAPA